MDADRLLARGGVEFYYMGTVFRGASDGRKIMAFKVSEKEQGSVPDLRAVSCDGQLCDF